MKNEVEETDFLQSCYHEAAHAVVAHVLNLPVENITVGPGYDGQVDYADGRGSRALAIASLAGPIAERRFIDARKNYFRREFFDGRSNSPNAGPLKFPALSDEDKICIKRYLAKNMFLGDGGRERQALEVEARQLVKQYWQQIERLVDALTEAVKPDFSARLNETQIAAALSEVKQHAKV